MRAALASLGCMSAALLLAVFGRPGSDWFESLGALLMYGLWAAAIVLALMGAATAVFAAGVSFRRRIVAAGASIATLGITVFLALAIISIVSHVR